MDKIKQYQTLIFAIVDSIGDMHRSSDLEAIISLIKVGVDYIEGESNDKP